MHENYSSYRAPRSITPEEEQKLIEGKFVKFTETDEAGFQAWFTDCPKPEKGLTKPFDKAYDPNQVYVFKYKDMCCFVTPSEYYKYDMEESKWYLAPIWQFFKSEKFHGCSKGCVDKIDRFILPKGILAKMDGKEYESK